MCTLVYKAYKQVLTEVTRPIPAYPQYHSTYTLPCNLQNYKIYCDRHDQPLHVDLGGSMGTWERGGLVTSLDPIVTNCLFSLFVSYSPWWSGQRELPTRLTIKAVLLGSGVLGHQAIAGDYPGHREDLRGGECAAGAR